MKKRAQHFRELRESGNIVVSRRKTRRDGAARVSRESSDTKSKAASRSILPDSLPVSVFNGYLEAWFADSAIALHSDETEQMRRSLFRRFSGYLDSSAQCEINEANLKQFFATLKNERTGKPLAPETHATFRRVFSTFFRSLVKAGHLSKNPMDAVPAIARVRIQETQPQIFGVNQLAALFSVASKSFSARRDVALLCLCLDTGLRASEIASLTIGDIEILERAIRVRGKGGKVRQVFFTRECYSALWNYWRERGVNPDEHAPEPLFVASTGTNAGQAMTRSGIYQTVARLCERAGITDGKKGPHRLRHTFATMMVANGAYPDTVQAFLGHSNPKMTQRYVTLGKADMKRQHEKQSPLASMRRKNTKR